MNMIVAILIVVAVAIQKWAMKVIVKVERIVVKLGRIVTVVCHPKKGSGSISIHAYSVVDSSSSLWRQASFSKTLIHLEREQCHNRKK